jgi:hypothetical protein
LRGKKYYKNIGNNFQKTIEEMNKKIIELNKNYEKEQNTENIKISEGIVTLSIYDKYNEKNVEILFDEHIWDDIKIYSFYLSDTGYVFSYINNKNTSIHVYLYKKYTKNFDENTTIDHININPLDNRLENLRAASFSLQNHNRNKNKNSIIKNIKGVTINGNKFIVNPYGKRFSFKYLEDASEKFNELAKEKYEDNAKLNPTMKTEKTKVIDILNIDDIDEEYIKNITHVELFKLVVKKKKWGGKNAKIYQTKVKAGNLEEYKQIAINLLREESK